MADRTVNININYKVNTAEIQKAAAASAAAQKATDNLNKSTKDYTKSSDQAGKQAATNIKQVDTAAKGASTSLGSVATQFNNIYQAAKAVVASQIAREIIDMTLNAARLAGNVEGVTRAFNKLPESTALMENLKKSTKGTVDELELMEKAVQAQNFGIPVQKLGTLLEFATAKAQQTGLSIDYLTNSIVTGLGRKSERIIDNLQLDIAKLRELIASGLDFRTAAIQLINEDLVKMGGYIETSATLADRLVATFKDLRKEIAVGAEPLTRGIITFLQSAIDGLRGGVKVIRGDFDKEVAHQQAVTEANSFKQRELTEDILKDKQKAADIVQQEINSQVQIIGRNNDELAQLREITNAYDHSVGAREEILKIAKQEGITELAAKKIFDQRFAGAEKAKAFYEFQNLKAKEYQKILAETLKTFTLTDGIDEDQKGIIEAKKAQIEGLQQALEKTRDLGDLGPGGVLVRQLEIAQAELADLQRAFKIFTDVPKTVLNYQKEIQANNKKNDSTERAKQLNAEFGNMDEVTKRIQANIDRIAAGLIQIPAAIPGIVDTRSELEKVFEEAKQFFIDAGTDIIANQIISIASQEANSYALRINNLQAFYKEQQVLAGDNEKQKDILRLQEARKIKELRRQQFQAEQRAQIAAAVVNTAASITKTASNLGFPAAIPFIIVAAAEGAAQIAIIKRQQSNFAKGVLNLKGPGTETSDSIPANLSKGESVMTARETRESGNILKAIRDNRLNDKLLQNLHLTKEGVKVVGMSDERIVKAINANKPPDIIRIGNQIYEARKSQDGVSTRIRRKAMG